MERIIIKFMKTRGAKFISHLDLMRTLNRALKRAGISLTYSKGFNPHASISLAAPLSLGIGSIAEYGDIEVEGTYDEGFIAESLNNALPKGICVSKVIKVEKKLPPAMALVDAARYSIAIGGGITEKEAEDLADRILTMNEILKLKKTKNGEKTVDIRPLIIDIRVHDADSDRAVFDCMIATGSKANLNPELLSEVIKEHSSERLKGYAEIVRQEVFINNKGEWEPLDTYIQGK